MNSTERMILDLEEAKEDLKTRMADLARRDIRRPSALYHWLWMLTLTFMLVSCSFATLHWMSAGDAWLMLTNYFFVMVYTVLLLKQQDAYTERVVMHIKRQGELELLDRFVQATLRSYDEQITSLRRSAGA